MGNLIFLIFIVYIIVKAGNRAKSAANENRPDRKRQDLSQSSGKRSSPGIAQTGPDSVAHVKEALGSGLHTVSSKLHSATSATLPSRTAAKGTSGTTGADQGKARNSTTEYLRQKALEDEQEHAREEQLEAIRLHRETGGKTPAMRYYDGDSIPKGMHIVKCSYCGAENLIADHRNPKEHTCYFCRETL